MDWNWLFSSVAQSIAALVGVLGAFLISRILSSEASFARNRQRTQELSRRSDYLADSAECRRFDWYNRRTLEDGLEDVASAVRNDQNLLSAREYYDEVGFSPYMPRAAVLDEIKRVGRVELEEKEAAMTTDYAAYVPHFDSTVAVAARQNLSLEREAISELVLAVKDHMRQVEEHLALISRQPDRSMTARATLAAVLVLFFGGVILPLSFLPVFTSDSTVAAPAIFPFVRLLVLAMAALVFGALVIWLGFINEGLKHPSSDLEALRGSLDVKHYSLYLKIRVDNGIPL